MNAPILPGRVTAWLRSHSPIPTSALLRLREHDPGQAYDLAECSNLVGVIAPVIEDYRERTPEEQLQAAVLFQSWIDATGWTEHPHNGGKFIGSRTRNARGQSRYRATQRLVHQQSAQAWFESGDREYPYSFLRICESLDLDATAIRRHVREYENRRAA